MESQVKQGKPTDNEIMCLAQDVMKFWKKLGWLLGLGEPLLDEIEADHATQMYEQSYAMLRRWKECNGSEATYRKLAEALNHNSINKSDLCMKYCVWKHAGQFYCRWTCTVRCTVYDRVYLCTCTGGCSFLVQEKGREEKSWVELTLRLCFVGVASLFLITGHSNFKPNVQGILRNESQIVPSLCLLVSEKREGTQLPRTHSQERP